MQAVVEDSRDHQGAGRKGRQLHHRDRSSPDLPHDSTREAGRAVEAGEMEAGEMESRCPVKRCS